MPEFGWPCERLDAHHEHDGCPGVRAHPATMIGGAHDWEREFSDARTKLAAAARRGKAMLMSQDRTGRPIDFDYWYKFNAEYKKFEWPKEVEQFSPREVWVGAKVHLTAPVGVEGEDAGRVYEVTEWDAATKKAKFVLIE